MAVKDVVNYYKQVENQYFELLDNVKDFEEAVRQNKVSEEQFEQAKVLTERVGENYRRLTVVMAMLNEPSRKSKKPKYKKQNAKVYEALEKDSSNAVVNENTDCLKNFKKLLEEIK